jgi:hypothetical protein
LATGTCRFLVAQGLKAYIQASFCNISCISVIAQPLSFSFSIPHHISIQYSKFQFSTNSMTSLRHASTIHPGMHIKSIPFFPKTYLPHPPFHTRSHWSLAPKGTFHAGFFLNRNNNLLLLLEHFSNCCTTGLSHIPYHMHAENSRILQLSEAPRAPLPRALGRVKKKGGNSYSLPSSSFLSWGALLELSTVINRVSHAQLCFLDA